MAKKTSFELYVLNGRQWRFEKAADNSGRAPLTDLARSLDGAGKSVVLLKETLDAKSGESRESVVFKSKSATGQLPGFGQRTTAPAPAPRPAVERGFTRPLSPAARAEAEADQEAAAEATRSGRRAAKAADVEEGLVRVALLGVLAAIIALAVAGPTAAGVYFALGWSVSHLNYLPPGGASPWVYGTFVIVALAVFIRVAKRLTERNVALTTASVDALSDTAAMEEPPKRPGRKHAAPEPEEFGAIPQAESSLAARERVPEMAVEAAPSAQGMRHTEAAAATQPFPAPAMSPQPSSSVAPALSPGALRAEHDLIQFISASLRQARNQVRKIDRMTRFGLMLYFGAGGAAACEHHDARPGEGADILGRHLSKFGFSPQKAQHFAGSLDDYMRDERNAEMGRAGTDAMRAYLAGSVAGAAAAILPALAFWGEPALKRQASAPITILFTDIVGSTELTQRLGDQLAQNLLHLHNAIARGALQLYAGTEVKHTGDGLMATFDRPEEALRAALAMQAQFAAERQRAASAAGAPLHVRIGIHCGIAIREENDLFGSPVQLTRRLVDAAPADGILVSDAVRREVRAMDARFAPAGVKQLKGFAEPVETFTVS
jgi:adenylate cyclase